MAGGPHINYEELCKATLVSVLTARALLVGREYRACNYSVLIDSWLILNRIAVLALPAVFFSLFLFFLLQYSGSYRTKLGYEAGLDVLGQSSPNEVSNPLSFPFSLIILSLIFFLFSVRASTCQKGHIFLRREPSKTFADWPDSFQWHWCDAVHL